MNNNDPAKIAAVLRSLVVYVICAVVAIIIGVMMTNPLTYSALGFVGALCAVLFIPILLRWHHPLMIMSWNTPIMVFFLKGDPRLCLVMIAISLTISIAERALNQQRFINVPTITWSLICLIGVVLITAKLTGEWPGEGTDDDSSEQTDDASAASEGDDRPGGPQQRREQPIPDGQSGYRAYTCTTATNIQYMYVRKGDTYLRVDIGAGAPPGAARRLGALAAARLP